MTDLEDPVTDDLLARADRRLRPESKISVLHMEGDFKLIADLTAALRERDRQLEAAREAIRWIVEESYPDEDMEVMGGPEDGPGTVNPREDLFTRMGEDENLTHRDDIYEWPEHTPAIAAIEAALASVASTSSTPEPKRYCIGCRARLGLPTQAEDQWPVTAPVPPGFRAETTECDGCGVTDVFLVPVASTPSTPEALDGAGAETTCPVCKHPAHLPDRCDTSTWAPHIAGGRYRPCVCAPDLDHA